MEDKVAMCIDIIIEEIEKQKKLKDDFDITGLTQRGKIQGLEIAKTLLTQYWEEAN